MLLKKLNLDNKILKDAKSSFNINYIENKSDESIVARYIIYKELKRQGINNYLPKVDNDWIPIFVDDNFWSISHKTWLVFVWISKDKIWLDIEVYKERDTSLLDKFNLEEYNLLGWKNWNNFYILWTAKESIIKYNLWKLDYIKGIKLISTSSHIKNISWINFTDELVFLFNWLVYYVYSWDSDDIFYSICC